MATAETVSLSLPHEPKEHSIKAFNRIDTILKKELQHMRHEHNKHEPEYFQAVSNLTDKQLTTFSSGNLIQVRTANSAYGLHLLFKLHLPESSPPGYIHFRAFVSGDEDDDGEVETRFHCIHTAQIDNEDGSKDFKAIFGREDALEWFDE